MIAPRSPAAKRVECYLPFAAFAFGAAFAGAAAVFGAAFVAGLGAGAAAFFGAAMVYPLALRHRHSHRKPDSFSSNNLVHRVSTA